MDSMRKKRAIDDKPEQIKKRNRHKQKEKRDESCMRLIESEKQIKCAADKKDHRQLG
jgi:hypothetical protein